MDIPSSLIGYLSPEQQALAHSLEAYNRFVYEHYTSCLTACGRPWNSTCWTTTWC